MKTLILPLLLTLISGWSLSAQLRLNVEGDVRISGSVLELIKPSNTGHILNLSSDGAAMDINATTDLYLNSGGNINLDANNPTGRIGIGTAGPATKLHVVGDRFRLSTPGDENRYIDLRTDGGALDLNPVGANFYIDPGVHDLILATQTGKVGIGTETPSHKLSVAGNTQIIGSLELFRTPGDSSLFIGPNTGQQDDGNNENTFIGTNAGKTNTSGYNNIFSGYNTGKFNTSGSVNTFLGNYAGYSNTSGSANTFSGFQAGFSNTTGSENTFIGRAAGGTNVLGTRNTFIGSFAKTLADSLDRAISIGFGAGVACSHCAVIGGLGPDTVRVGIGTDQPKEHLEVRNFLGNAGARIHAMDGGISHLRLYESTDYGFEFQYDGQPDRLYLWSRKFAGNEAIRMTWLKNGNVGIGTTDPAKLLDVNGEAIFRDENKLTTFLSTGANAYLSFENNGGTAGADLGYFNDTNDQYFFINTPGGAFGELVINGPNVGLGVLDPNYQLQLSTNSAAKPSSSTWTVASDKRLKKEVQAFTDGLDVLQKIEPVWYRYNGKAGLPDQERNIGIIAQDMQRIAPYTIGEFASKHKGPNEKYLSFDANALFYITINAVKEQQELIEAQEKVIQSLRAEMEEFKQLMKHVLVDKQVSAEAHSYVLSLEQKPGLAQNHPNPFHQQTVIPYFLSAEAGDAYLQVTSTDGKVLGKVSIQEAGAGQVIIKANAFPAGTYYYSLVVNGQIVETKKMILTR